MLINSPDKIAGNDLIKEIESIAEYRNILNLKLIGQGYEALTIITDVDDSKSRPRFLIDYPSGNRDIINNSAGSRVFFEYNGKDRLRRIFKTVIDEVRKDGIWVCFPESIDRIQRRKHFRISPPVVTILFFEIGRHPYECYVLNISQGGALIEQESRFHEKRVFYTGRSIRMIRLKSDKKYAETDIMIKRADIIRSEKSIDENKCLYGLKFTDMDKKNRSDLGVFIYKCQREVLKRRSFMGIE
ncbi:MAG: PilZ domain-containing protein [Deltaproteobacteria bacterium]|nr:PilZ domain-containing protein [Deltaproteobacteria bacterium]